MPGTACGGYSIKFTTNTLEAARRNALDRLSDSDFDVDEMEMQRLIKEMKDEKKDDKEGKRDEGKNK